MQPVAGGRRREATRGLSTTDDRRGPGDGRSCRGRRAARPPPLRRARGGTRDARFGFEVLLPTVETPIAEVLDDVGAEQWRELSERASLEELPVALPAFDLEAEHDLEDPLRALGIERAWGDGHDFTAMSPANPWLDTVAQKAVIEVDGDGTEAAAVTGGVMAESAPEVTEVVVDRSFAFAIRDTETGVPLFLGIVDDPS